MALVARELGHPWVHEGITCDDCRTNPIEGYRYKCESCPNHDLCERCYRGKKHLGHKFLQVARNSSKYLPPFQIYYIVCRECGKAPIEGRCHRNKWRPNLYLCDSCFSSLPHSGIAGVDWEVLDEPKISTICKTRSPVFHFHRQCESCGISPILGTRFDALAYPENSMCLICFDTKFVKGLVRNGDYLRIEKPERDKVRQIFIYSCQSCGDSPIDGPAFVRSSNHEAVCLPCYISLPRQQQLEYSRVEAPSQYGDPPHRSSPQLPLGVVSAEEYSRLGQEFEQFTKEKAATAKVVASNLLKQAEEIKELRKELEKAQRATSVDAARNLGRSEETKEATILRADYTRLVGAFEKLQQEKDEAIRAASDYSNLSLQLERLKIENAEALRLNAEHAQQLKQENEESAQVKTNYDNLAHEIVSLKVAAAEAAKSKELEHASLVQELERLKDETAEAAKVAAENHSIVLTENERLKAERDEAAEYASFAKELEGLEQGGGEPDTKNSEEYLLLLKEVEELREERSTLAGELDSIKELAEVATKEAEERYSVLNRDVEELREERTKLAGELVSVKERAEAATVDTEERYSLLSKEMEKYQEEEAKAALILEDRERLKRELEILKEMNGSVLSVKEEEHASLLREFEMYKQEKGELEMSSAQEYAKIVQTNEKLLEDKAWLVQEVENVYKEMDEAAKISSDNEVAFKTEIERLKEEMDSGARARTEEHTRLVQECNKLTLEKEATVVMHASLVRRFEKLEIEKEEESRSRTVEFANLVAEIERLKEENDEVGRTRAEDDLHLRAEIARLKEDMEEAVRGSATKYLNLVEEFDKVRDEKDRELKTSKADNLSVVEEFDRFKREKEEAGRTLEEQYFKFRDDLEQLNNEKGEMAKRNSDLARRVEVLQVETVEKQRALQVLEKDYSNLLRECDILREEKEAEASLASNLTLELQKLDDEMETYKREQEESAVANDSEHKKLLTEFESLRREKVKELQEKEEKLLQARGNLDALTEVNAALKEKMAEKVSSLSQEMELMRAEKEENERASVEESSRLHDELEKCKSFAFVADIPDIGSCAQVAISTYGAMVLKKKGALEAGYAKSTFSKGDTKTLKEAERFLTDASRQFDDEYDGFQHEARLVTDVEVRDYYLAHFRPDQMKRAHLDMRLGSAELAAARRRFG